MPVIEFGAERLQRILTENAVALADSWASWGKPLPPVPARLRADIDGPPRRGLQQGRHRRQEVPRRGRADHADPHVDGRQRRVAGLLPGPARCLADTPEQAVTAVYELDIEQANKGTQQQRSA